jgi:hypothetical protein
MKNFELELINFFESVKTKGWIPTHRHGDQMLGNTFEDLLGVVENNISTPDWNGIEIKTHRNETSSPISLFTKSPDHPVKANTYLRLKYGVSDNEFNMPKLNTRLSPKNFNTHRSGFGFRVEVDNAKQRLKLLIKKLNNDELVDDEIFWDFDTLRKCVESKIKKIAILYGDNKKENDSNYVRFTRIDIIKGITFNKMLLALENDDLMVELRLDVYKTGKNKGKTHDHGTAFRIKLDKLLNYGDVTSV